MCWKDQALVLFASNTLDCGELVDKLRKRPKGTNQKMAQAPFQGQHVKRLPIPLVIDVYNNNMNGVDQGDQLHVDMGGRGRQYKNWKALFFRGLLAIAVTNGYLLSRYSRVPKDNKYESQTLFKKRLAEELMRASNRVPPKRMQQALDKRKLGTISDHHWQRMKQRQCGYCSRVNGNILREGPANKRARVLQERSPNLNVGIASSEKAIKRPLWGCVECDINLCKRGNDCWKQWHHDLL